MSVVLCLSPLLAVALACLYRVCKREPVDRVGEQLRELAEVRQLLRESRRKGE